MIDGERLSSDSDPAAQKSAERRIELRRWGTLSWVGEVFRRGPADEEFDAFDGRRWGDYLASMG